MSELIVIYDPEQELGAIIDAENQRAFGPAAAGPHARDFLVGWLETLTFDPGLLDQRTASALFVAFTEEVAAAVDKAPEPSPAGPSLAAVPEEVSQVKLAEAEAHAAAGEPPPPAPADTDVPAPAPVPQEADCFSCGGVGTVTLGEGEVPVRCGMCDGTGKITITPAA